MRRGDIPGALVATAAGSLIVAEGARASTCSAGPCYPNTPWPSLISPDTVLS